MELNKMPSKPIKSGSNQPTSETPFKWRFAGRLIVAQEWLLDGYWLFDTS